MPYEPVTTLSFGAATLASALLLGLAAAALHMMPTAPERVRQPLGVAGLLLLSLALWWPLHLSTGHMLLVRGGQVPAALAPLAPLLMEVATERAESEARTTEAAARAAIKKAGEEHLHDNWATMALQLKDVFAGK